MATDHKWSQQLLLSLPEAVHGPLLGVSAPVANPAAKRALHLKTGALAVDMESHIVARLSVEHGLPMVAIRVITDPALRALPRTAVAAMRSNGTTDIVKMISSLMKRPHELPALVRTALDAWAARAMLVRGRQLLGPALSRTVSQGLIST
jgi:hypothetical protein